jgi:hypothetical protein
MNDGPFRLSELVPLAWVFFVSALGGLASWVRKVRAGNVRVFNIVELIGELIVSAFAGLLTYWICRAAALDEWSTAAAVGIAGHMGSRALFLLENTIEARLRKAPTDAG